MGMIYNLLHFFCWVCDKRKQKKEAEHKKYCEEIHAAFGAQIALEMKIEKIGECVNCGVSFHVSKYIDELDPEYKKRFMRKDKDIICSRCHKNPFVREKLFKINDLDLKKE